jgi:hypothetical protein
VVLYVKLDGLTGLVCRALVMTVSEMRVMRGGFMAACLMMRRCFAVMVGSVLEMLGGPPMVLCSLLRHRSTSLTIPSLGPPAAPRRKGHTTVTCM